MIARRLIKVFLGLVFAVLVVSAWSTPSMAHVAHDVASASTSSTGPTSKEAFVDQDRAVVSAVCDELDAWSGGGLTSGSSCCGYACHAAMASELDVQRTDAVAVAIAPSLLDPPTLTGPMGHLKRPPRSLAAGLVG